MLRRRLLTCLLMLAKRPRLLAAYSILLGSTVLAAPWIWAVYHLHQARKELTRYHSHDARRHLAAYLRWRPHDVSAHLMAARANRRLGDYAQAEQHLLQAQREQKKTSEDVILEWALHRAALGDLEQTEFYLLPLVQDDCEQAMLVCEALAEGYRRTYRIVQSGRLLDLWLNRRPDDVRALLLRASLRQDINNCQQAVPDFRRVLELEPDCEEAQRGLASCLTESARLDEAASYWQELYRRHPADVEVRVNLARCWSGLGRVQEAKQALQAVLEERPDHLLALRGLGRIWLQQENPAEAVIWLRRAVRAAPKDYRSHLLLYQALHKQGETTEAEQHLDEANQLELHWQRLRQLTQHDLIARPQDVAVQSEIGIVLLALGYEEAGRNWLLSALRCDPLCRSAREALERVPLRNPSPEH